MPYEAKGEVLVVDDDPDDMLLLRLAIAEKIVEATDYTGGLGKIGSARIKGLVTDGLEGWWESLVKAAIGAKIPPQAIILCSASATTRQYESMVKDLGIRSVSKQMPGFSREVAKIVSGW